MMVLVEQTVQELKKDQRWTDKFGTDTQHLYSYDNATVHTSADLGRVGIDAALYPEGQRLPLPAKSPDMHKVVEHVHANLASKFRAWHYANASEDLTMLDYRAHMERLFLAEITAQSIAKDVATLHKTYDAIRLPVNQGGVYGGWPASGLR